MFTAASLTLDPMLNLLKHCYRYTQPEKLASKEYSCAKCGKAAHVRWTSYTLSHAEGSKLIPAGSKQTIEHSEATSSSKLSVQGNVPHTHTHVPHSEGFVCIHSVLSRKRRTKRQRARSEHKYVFQQR